MEINEYSNDDINHIKLASKTTQNVKRPNGLLRQLLGNFGKFNKTPIDKDYN